MDTPVIDAYTTNAILGGITIAIELEVAISAVETVRKIRHARSSPGSVPYPVRQRLRTGTGDCSEEAGYDNTHDRDTTSGVSHAGINETDQSFGNTGFCMMLPDNTKNGIASNRNLLIPEYMLVATIVSEVPEYRIAQIDDNPRQIPIGIPRIRNNKKRNK